MYKVKITEQRGRRSNTKIYDFCGEFTEEVRQQWEKIKKKCRNTYDIRVFAVFF